jgi:hypothetical protein
MHMQLSIAISGDVVERQELLNGTQTITIEGASEDGAWSLVGSVSWNRGLVDYAGEGDLTLARNGDEIFATLTRVEVSDAADELAADHLLEAAYDVDGGTGAFAEASGSARCEASLGGERFEGVWTVALGG